MDFMNKCEVLDISRLISTIAPIAQFCVLSQFRSAYSLILFAWAVNMLLNNFAATRKTIQFAEMIV